MKIGVQPRQPFLGKALGTFVLTLLRTYGVVLALVILVALVEIGNSGFLTTTNVMNLLSQWAPAGVMAIGQTYVILTGGFDLSIGSGFALCAVVSASLGQSHDVTLSFLAAIAVGLVIGLMNGVLVAAVRINPFIATIGTGFVANGVALIAAGNTGYEVTNPSFTLLGAGRWHNFPYSGMLLIGFFFIGGLILAKTVYGQSIYAVGGNAEASRLSGLPVGRLIGSTYVISGFCMGVAGILAASQVGSAQANLDPTIVFDVLTIVVIGGTSLSGGVGSMWRTAVGLALIATISNAFDILNVNPYYQNIVKGAIIIGALALDSVTRGLITFGRWRTPLLRWRQMSSAAPPRDRGETYARQDARH